MFLIDRNCSISYLMIHHLIYIYIYLLPTGSEERDVLGVGSIPVAILPSGQDIKKRYIIIAQTYI